MDINDLNYYFLNISIERCYQFIMQYLLNIEVLYIVLKVVFLYFLVNRLFLIFL